jgi:predicted amidohydrolase
MRLALVQLAQDPGHRAGNVERAVAAVEDAAADGADLVVLPELFTVGYFAFDSYAREAESLDGPTLSRMADAADDCDVGLLAGTVVEDLAASADAGFDVPAADGLASTATLFDRDGTRRLVSRTRNLYGYAAAADRLDRLVTGERLPTAEFEGFTVGVTTGSTLRRPEPYRGLVDAGATLLAVPSAWPYPRVEQWATLPRARAVENAAYVACANGAGSFADATLLGRSTVYDPRGTPVASCDDEPTTVTATVDPAVVAATREEFPVEGGSGPGS